jgi:hypothetical protein
MPPRYPWKGDGCAYLRRHHSEPNRLAADGPLRDRSSRSDPGSRPTADRPPQSSQLLPHGAWTRAGGRFTSYVTHAERPELHVSSLGSRNFAARPSPRRGREIS